MRNTVRLLLARSLSLYPKTVSRKALTKLAVLRQTPGFLECSFIVRDYRRLSTHCVQHRTLDRLRS